MGVAFVPDLVRTQILEGLQKGYPKSHSSQEFGDMELLRGYGLKLVLTLDLRRMCTEFGGEVWAIPIISTPDG